jgi:uncharacterized protein with PQ loop repeat
MRYGHAHLRHRAKRESELGTMRNKKWYVDTVVYALSIINLVLTLDQARIIFYNQSAKDVSMIMWIFYTVSSVAWVLYGYVHKDKILIRLNYAWSAVSLLVLIGILMYA